MTRPNSTHLSAIVIGVLVLAAISQACEWDYDTLQMEQQRFPDAIELITGKFLRHSEEYYHWRIEDRIKRLKQSPNDLALYDDLAVAYDKTGQQPLAIETILKKESIKPGQYETFANLGTFHIHAGNLEEGVKQLKRAIEINPDAHFGREIYQQLLVEYVISRKVDGKLQLPLSQETSSFQSEFAEFVFKSRNTPNNQEARDEEAKAALKGVLGMMRFGNYRSPILLEATGDLLRANWNNDAKRLASRAYLKASQETDDPKAAAGYLKLAKATLGMQTVSPRSTKELTIAQVRVSLADEVKAADEWHASIRNDELQWIKEGVDVDAAFTKKYYHGHQQAATATPSANRTGIYIAIGVAALIAIGLLVWRPLTSTRSP